MPDGRICTSLAVSSGLSALPVVYVDYVFIDPSLRREAEEWLRINRVNILEKGAGVDEHGAVGA